MNKDKLEIIKEGKTGHGILIEKDGYISLENNKQIAENIGNGEWHVPNPFIVKAVFQKFGIKNANGRIYPENVLKREVEKYQQKIIEKRALGECYRPEALILTESGWKTLEDVKEGENILTLNTDTNGIEIKPILRKIEKDFDGNMINIHNSDIDDIVTPNHKYVLYDRDGKFYKRHTAKEIMEGKVDDPSHKFIPRMGERIGGNGEAFTIENGITLDARFLKADEVPYKGKVMCVEVENHTWYVMDNLHSHWTSNCNHPSESTIDLSRVSHNITELHWENSTLVGEMELNITEGFRKYGIVSSRGDEVANLLLNGYKVGVSSRGVGSVEQRLGQYIVGDDFELICWDVVSDPSTPNAYITLDGDEGLIPYIENKKVDTNNKTKINEKIEKIKNILNS
jgi:hypothetical protein